jgi:hypothetical protein
MQPVIFVHIQKTGGMSLASMMHRRFPRERVFQVNGTLCFAAEQLTGMPAARRANMGFIYGHVPFGLHDYLPRAAAAYVTVLRNPVDRMVSIYYYALRLCSAKTFRSWHETPIAVSNFQQATSTTGGLLYHARGTELAQDRG